MGVSLYWLPLNISHIVMSECTSEYFSSKNWDCAKIWMKYVLCIWYRNNRGMMYLSNYEVWLETRINTNNTFCNAYVCPLKSIWSEIYLNASLKIENCVSSVFSILLFAFHLCDQYLFWCLLCFCINAGWVIVFNVNIFSICSLVTHTQHCSVAIFWMTLSHYVRD